MYVSGHEIQTPLDILDHRLYLRSDRLFVDCPDIIYGFFHEKEKHGLYEFLLGNDLRISTSSGVNLGSPELLYLWYL